MLKGRGARALLFVFLVSSVFFWRPCALAADIGGKFFVEKAAYDFNLVGDNNVVLSIDRYKVRGFELRKWKGNVEVKHDTAFVGKQLATDKLLRKMTDYNLVIFDGIRRGVLKRGVLASRIRNYEIVVLGNHHIDHRLSPRFQKQVSPEDVQQKLKFRDREAKLRIIGLESLEKAIKIRQEVAQGGDFASLARQHSILPSAGKGGDLGILSHGSGYLPDQMDDLVFTGAATGFVSDVFELPFGFCFIMVEEVLPATPELMIKMANIARDNLANVRLQEHLDGLIRPDKVKYNPKPLREIDRYNDGSSRGNPWIARYGDLEVRANDFILFLKDFSKDPDGLLKNPAEAILAYLKHLALYKDYRKRGILPDPEYISTMVFEEKKILYDNLIARDRAGEDVTDDRLRKYYEENPDMFRRDEAIDLSVIFLKDRKTADDVRSMLERRGKTFPALAEEYSMDESAARGGRLGFVERKQMPGEIWEKVFPLDNGEVTGVIEHPPGFFIVRKDGYSPERRFGFEESKVDIRKNLLEELDRARYSRIIGKLQAEIPVTLNAEYIKEIVDGRSSHDAGKAER